MEPSNGPTYLEELESGIAGLSLTGPVSNPASARLPPRSQSTNKKRRLATNRGFGNPVRGASFLVTPTNSPSKFQPELGSTPVTEPATEVQLVTSSSLYSSRQLPPHPPFSPSVIHQNPTLFPSIQQPSLLKRATVISPRITVEEASLDWDNYDDSPSFNPSLEQQGTQSQYLNLSSCLREIQGITGLEDIQKVTLVNTSESSLSTDSLPILHQQNPQSQSIMSTQQSQARILENMKVCVEEMMEDFSATDVRKGNLDEVPKMLEEISKARSEFRNSARDYKQSYSLATSSIEWLNKSVSTLNQQVKDHAHSIWTKVEQVQTSSGATPAPPPTSHVPASSHSREDMDYKRKIYRDQLLYLTEALLLPDDEDSVEEHWKEKTESDVCSAMRELSNWQKSVQNLSRSFREYERMVQQFGDVSNLEFVSDSEDFENIRIKVKEVSIAVKNEDQRRNLQSLLPTKSEKVKYPNFSGDSG